MTWTLSTDAIAATATTVPMLNERGAACYGLQLTVTAGGTATDFTAPGSFFVAEDWGALAEVYLSRALEGRLVRPFSTIPPFLVDRRI